MKRATEKPVSLSFVPHLLPLRRGILSTIFCKKAGARSLQDIWEGYHSIYGKEPFVRLYPLGESPNLHAVLETNFIDLSLHEDQGTGEIILVSAEDNLVKGAAGQAVQNFNLKMGFAEETALALTSRSLEPAIH